MTLPRFAGAVLTGGASRRMGTDKALVEVDGMAMAGRVAGALASAGGQPVIAVGGDADRLADLGLAVTPDRWPGEGPLGGLVTALGALADPAVPIVVVAACDLPALTSSVVAALVAALAERCIGPSPIGATILDRPHPNRAGMLAPGWDCNGGVWAAVNGLLAWGLARHDVDLAWSCLRAQSLAAHARAYPHVWYGIWSGPDAFNAHFGSRPGETFVQPATPMAEFPVMNSNAHAAPLLGLLGVLGLQTGPAGVHVAGRLGGPPWRLACPLGTWSSADGPGAAAAVT